MQEQRSGAATSVRGSDSVEESNRESHPHNIRPTWCGSGTEADVSRPAQGPCRAPPGGTMRSAVPAQKAGDEYRSRALHDL